MKTGITLATTLTLGLALGNGPALADDYPSKPITVIAPFAAGSATDSVTRILAAKLQDRLKQPVLVENKPGANASIGAELVARAEPDGYTLLFATSTSHSSNPSLFKSLRYDPVKDFTPIGRTVDLSYVLLVHPDLPVKSVKELVDYAKANPDKLSYATPNSPSLIASETMRYMSGIQIVGVPYKASPQAFTDLVGGRVQFYVADVTSSINSIKNGQVRALAVTTPAPIDKLPGVPPLSQTFPGLDLVSWGGIFGPAKMSGPVVAKLGRELNAVLADPEVKERLAGIGFEVAPSKSPEEFAGYVREQIGVWANLVKQARIEPQ